MNSPSAPVNSLRTSKTLFLSAGFLFALAVFLIQIAGRMPMIAVQVKGSPLSVTENGRMSRVWIGQTIQSGSRLATEDREYAELRLSDHLNARLESRSEMIPLGPRFCDREKKFTLQLQKGTLLAAPGRDIPEHEMLEIRTPASSVRTRNGVLAVRYDPVRGLMWTAVLRGQALVEFKARPGEKIELGNLQKLEWTAGEAAAPQPLSLNDWRKIYDAYALIPRPIEFQWQQLAVAKKTGNLFDYAYYVGDFWTAKQGYLESKFLPSPDGVYLDIFYDLFSPGAFAGVYFKTRDLDLSEISGFSVEARMAPVLPAPRRFRMEFKNGQSIITAVDFTELARDWKKIRFPIQISNSVNISEIVVVATYEETGLNRQNKQAGMQLRHFEFERADPSESPKPAEQEKEE